MLRSLREVLGYRVLTVDDEAGPVRDFYFDDHHWTVRYVVVDTGKWLPGRKVLISPERTASPNWEEQCLPVTLSRTEIETCPGASEELPVSLQERINISQYYVWSPTWVPAGTPVVGMPVPVLQSEGAVEKPKEGIPIEERTGDPRLRSMDEVLGYRIATETDEIGHLHDLIADTDSWVIRYLIVDTRNWLPGRKVLVSPLWIERIDWADSRVHVNLTSDQIKDAPSYDPNQPVNRTYERRLYDFYGRPAYWEK